MFNPKYCFFFLFLEFYPVTFNSLCLMKLGDLNRIVNSEFPALEYDWGSSTVDKKQFSSFVNFKKNFHGSSVVLGQSLL